MKNANVTKPGGDGNPGARKKAGQTEATRSRHVAQHLRRQERRERAYARGAKRPKADAQSVEAVSPTKGKS